MATTRRTKSPTKQAPARTAEHRPFELVGPIHWGYPFTVALSGKAKREVTDFLTRFTALAKPGELSGYVIHDDDDLDTAVAAFEKNRPAIPYSCFVAAWGRDLAPAQRREALAEALARPTDRNRAIVERLLGTWPADDDPQAAEAQALAAAEAWPRYFRRGSMRTEKAAAAGDLTLHRAWVRSYASNQLEANLAKGLYDGVEDTQFESPAELIAHLDRFRQLREVGFRGVPTAEQWDAIKEMPEVEELGLWHFGSRAKGYDAARWRDAPLGRKLRVLEVYGVKLGAADLAPFAQGPATLEHLKLTNTGLKGAAAGKALAALGAHHGIRTAVLEYNELEGPGVKAMFAKGSWSRLEALNLSANEIGDEGITAIARNGSLERLRWFTCRSDDDKGQIHEAGAAALADAAALGSLATLGLVGQPLGSDGVARILSSPRLRSLRRVVMGYCSASWQDVIGALRGREIAPLTHLDASSWNTEGQVDWEGATFLRGVKHLRLDGLPGDQYGPFLACGHFDALEGLVLGGGYAANEAAADALCKAAPLPRLKTLSLKGWRMQAAQAEAFAASPLFSTLPAVELMAMGYVQPAAAKAFLARGIRPVATPEFDEYFLHESPFPDIHVQVPEP